MPWGALCDLRTTWFVISPHLTAVNEAQSTKQQVKDPGSLLKDPRSLFLLKPGYCPKRTLTRCIFAFTIFLYTFHYSRGSTQTKSYSIWFGSTLWSNFYYICLPKKKKNYYIYFWNHIRLVCSLIFV